MRRAMTRLREAIRGRSAKLPSRHRGRNLRQDRGSKKVDRWQETGVGDGFVHHLVFLFFHIILVNPSIFWIARCELLLVIIVIRKAPPRQFKKHAQLIGYGLQSIGRLEIRSLLRNPSKLIPPPFSVGERKI